MCACRNPIFEGSDSLLHFLRPIEDNTGNTTEFLRGEGSDGKIIYYADKVTGPKGEVFMRRLSFTKLSADKVRQLGEKSDDAGKTWVVEYDLEYRRKK